MLEQFFLWLSSQLLLQNYHATAKMNDSIYRNTRSDYRSRDPEPIVPIFFKNICISLEARWRHVHQPWPGFLSCCIYAFTCLQHSPPPRDFTEHAICLFFKSQTSPLITINQKCIRNALLVAEGFDKLSETYFLDWKKNVTFWLAFIH